MIRLPSIPRLRRLRQDERGATAIEFGMICLPLFLMILASLDFGHTMYVQGVMNGAMMEAVRVASIGGKTEAQVDQVVKDRLKTLVKPANLSFERKSYANFSSVRKGEVLADDKNSNGAYDTGDCFYDANGDTNYSTDQGKSGLGSGDDIFFYKVTADYPRLVGPLGRMLNLPARQVVVGETMMRNQPYAAQQTPPVVCK